MAKKLVYDLPTRIFHWLFSGLFVMAFVIAKTIDDESPAFSYHMLAGLTLGALVLLRIVWGFVGSKYARFSSFELHAKALVLYVKGILNGDKRAWICHNPASSWGTLIMLGSALMLAISGILMTTGQKEEFEDFHELAANAFLVTVLLHVAGIILHSIRHLDGIALSMVTGKKTVIEKSYDPVKSKPIEAILLVVLITAFTMYLSKNYNTETNKLKVFGKTLLLGDTP